MTSGGASGRKTAAGEAPQMKSVPKSARRGSVLKVPLNNQESKGRYLYPSEVNFLRVRNEMFSSARSVSRSGEAKVSSILECEAMIERT